MAGQCVGGTCPSLLITDNGEIIVQGYELSPEENKCVTKPRHETFVKMTPETLRNLVAHL